MLRIDNFNLLKDCVGCGNCKLACPTQCITMKENGEGFYYPQINNEQCINCGICSGVCVINYQLASKESKSYAVYDNNKENLILSSSGGVNNCLSNKFLDMGGIVVGASYDSRWNVRHICVKDKSELYKIRSSKYVISNLNDVFIDVKEYLEKGHKVLFTGTSCQVAALYKFMKKDYSNLYTISLICHGVPSQKAFKEYIKYLEKKFKSKVDTYNFRDKTMAGWGVNISVTFENGKKFYTSALNDPYCNDFLNCRNFRESCYKCKFSNMNRVSDLTVGDFWGIDKCYPHIKNGYGVSLVLSSSSKGATLMEYLLENSSVFETEIDKSISFQENLNSPSIRPTIRDFYYKNNLFDKYCRWKNKFVLKEKIKYKIPYKLKEKIKKIFKKQ